MFQWSNMLLFVVYFYSTHMALAGSGNSYHYFQEGRHYQYTLNDYEKALASYEKADAIMPCDDNAVHDFSGMYNDMGVLSMSQRSWESAEIAFIKALNINPHLIAALSNLAEIKYAKGDIDEASRLYSTAANLPDVSAELLFNYGIYLSRLGNKAEAMSLWKRAIEAVATLAMQAGQEGDFDKAFAMYERAKSLASEAGDESSYYSYSCRQLLAVIPMIFASRNHSDYVRHTYISNLLKALTSLPVDAVPYPLDNLSGALGYYLIYQGHNDIIPRQLHALLFSRVSRSYIFGAPAQRASAYGLESGQPESLDDEDKASLAFLNENHVTTIDDDNHQIKMSSMNDKRLRVGFMSYFFYHHSVGLLLQGVIKNLDSTKFHKSLIYPSDMPQDELTQGLLQATETHLVVNSAIRFSRDAATTRRQIRALHLDVLVYGEIGMDGATYFLSFARLAKRSVVFWGHAMTSGVVDWAAISHMARLNSQKNADADSAHLSSTLMSPWYRGGPDYFVSSELFESHPYPQNRYSERLILQSGMTAQFEIPKAPLTATELQLPSSNLNAPFIVIDIDGKPILQDQPDRSHLLTYLTAPNSNTLENIFFTSGISTTGFHLYGVPQTLYKLCPEIISLFRDILRVDGDGILVLPSGLDADLAANAKEAMRSVFGEQLFSRVLFTRTMSGREFLTLCGVFDVVLDTFPVGGGRSSFEIFSVGTPIVLLYPKTSILQLTYGMYRTMGIDCTLCIAHTEDDYISGAIAIASNASLQYSLRVDILRYNKRLYNNHSIITEWEKMLEYVVSTPRPTPFAELIAGDESVGYELKFDTGDSSFSDATLVRTQSFIVNDARFAEELDLAVSLPYNGKEPIVISALKSRSPVDSVPVPMTTRCSNESFIKCADFLLSENSTKLSLAILLTRPQHVSGSVLEWFPSFVASLELSLGHSLPGGQIKEVVVVDNGLESFTPRERVQLSAKYQHFFFYFEKSFRSKKHANTVRARLNAMSTVFKIVSQRHVFVIPSSVLIPNEQWRFSTFHGSKNQHDTTAGKESDSAAGVGNLNGVLQLALNVIMGFEVVEEYSNSSHTSLLMRQGAHVVVLTGSDTQPVDAEKSSQSRVLIENDLDRLQGFLSKNSKLSITSCPQTIKKGDNTLREKPYCMFYNVSEGSNGLCKCGVHFGGYLNPKIEYSCQSAHDNTPLRRFCRLLSNACVNADPDDFDIDSLSDEINDIEESSSSLRILTNLHSFPTLWDLDAVAAVILKEEEQFMYSTRRFQDEDSTLRPSDIQRGVRSHSVNHILVRPPSLRMPDWESHQRAAIVFDREESKEYATLTAMTNSEDRNWIVFHRVGNLRMALRFLAAGVRLAYMTAPVPL